MKAKDNAQKAHRINKTLTGLILKSKSSGAVYFWNRKLQKTVIISDSEDRPIGHVASIFSDASLYMKNGKLIMAPDLANPNYDILLEIHNVKL